MKKAAPPDQDKAAPDWERIEVDYRANVLSVREVGRLHSVSHTAIGNRAKDEGWTRDLGAKIKAKANAEVAKRQVATQVASLGRVSEKQVIEANAEAIVQVRLSHRHDIRRGRAVVSSLLSELEMSCGPETAAMLAEFGQLMRSEDKNGQDRRNDLYEKLMSMGGRVKAMKDLGDSMRVLVALEREAYGLEDAPGEAEQGNARIASMTDAERAVRLSRLISSNPDALAALMALKNKAAA